MVSSPPPTDHNPYELTPIRAHYLKKSLIQLQFSREIQAITSSASTLSYLGTPFSPPPKDPPIIDLPFLRYLFRQFVLTFPLLASAPKDFFPNKVQPFISSLLSRNLNSTSILDDESTDSAGTAKLVAKAERSFSLFLNYAVKTVEKEETVRLSQADLDKLEAIARKRHAKLMKTKDVFEVNVVCVRTVVDRGRVRSKVHEEFIIRTRRSHYKDVYVSRRYGDFKTLYNELRKAHPDEEIRPPPAKDRTYVNSRARELPLSPTVSNTSSSFETSASAGGSYDSPPASPVPTVAPSLRLAREKNRLTLRAYLHALMSSATIASSPVIKSFLSADPTTLTNEEIEDAQRREEADRTRDEGRKQFAREVSARVDSLRSVVKGMKGDLLGRDGLTRMFAVIKATDDLRDLPPEFKAVIEWGRISMASTVFHHFIASDEGSESLAGLKRIHGFMPYFMLKAALKISNPVAMIRSVLDLFLAQPFGGRSLLQRMFTSSLNEEVKSLEEDIEAVKEKVDDPVICEKVRQFVYAPKEIQAIYKGDSARENIHILAAVLRSGEEPILSRAQMQRVVRSHRAHQEYLKYRGTLEDSDDDDGPQNEDAWLFEDLAVLTKLYSRLKDKDQLISLIFEGSTADLMKDIITIFYSPLAQVYRAASISDSIGDVQNFINDLIKTVEATEELSQDDPQQTVQIFIDLIQRHEQSFYYFVHKVHSKGEGLFSGLMHWIELFLDMVREGLGEPISLEFILPHTGDERRDTMKEIDEIALHHYKLKIAHESKLRRRFGRAGGADISGDDENTREIVGGLVRDVSLGDFMKGGMLDVAAEEEESSDDSEESSSDYESDADDGETASEESSESSSRTPSQLHASPSTPTLPKVTPQESFPPSQPSKFAVPPPAKSPMPTPSPSPSPSPQPPARAPSVASPSSTGTRLRRLSLTLRKSRSMTFGATRPSSSNNAEAPPPPVPPVPSLPPSVAQSRSAALLTASRSKQPQSSSASSASPSRRPAPNAHAHARASEKRYPSQKLPQAPKRKSKSAPQAPKPPELKKIAELLPIFVEMMRPSLRPRERPEGQSGTNSRN